MIAIIAILAAILFPVFARARESARQTQCVSNFRQAALAQHLYLDDYSETFVLVNQAGFGGPNYGRYPIDQPWPLLVQPYMKNYHIWRCPSDPNAVDESLYRNIWDNNPVNDPKEQIWHAAWRADLGYNYNWLSYATDPCRQGIMKVASMAQVRRPAKTILLIDSIWDRDSSGAPKGGGNWAVDAPSWPPDLQCWLGGWQCYLRRRCLVWNAYGGCWPWHASGTIFNVVYVDGHTKAQRLGDLLAGVNPRTGAIYDGEAFQWWTE